MSKPAWGSVSSPGRRSPQHQHLSGAPDDQPTDVDRAICPACRGGER